MKKGFQRLVDKLQREGGTALTGGFTIIRGGIRQTNYGECVNSVSCDSINTGSCDNKGDCTQASNAGGGGTCTNYNCVA